MQQLQLASNDAETARQCAGDLLAAIPSIMRYIRHEMRSHRRSQLSIPQFRALVFVSVYENPSLSALAEHLGLSLPAASRMVDLLVRRGLLLRRTSTRDRRHMSLSVTRRGDALYRYAHHATRDALAQRFESLTPAQRLQIGRSMKILGRVFDMVSPPDDREPRRNPSARH